MQTLSIVDLQTAVHSALRAWDDLGGTTTNLLEFLLLVKQERLKIGNSPTSFRLATNQVLTNGIEVVGEQDPQAADILSLRFMDDYTVLMVGGRLGLSEDKVKRRQREAIRRLTQIIFEQETAVRTQRTQTLQAELMALGYTRLFGVQEILDELVRLLQSPADPWVVAVVGIGGIGKTSLADAAVREVIQQFQYEGVVWLRFEQQNGPTPDADSTSGLDQLLIELAENICPDIPQNIPFLQRKKRLQQTLKASPYLIVIDNLESETTLNRLLDVLGELANPSKFLLTTRIRPPSGASVSSLVLGEIPAEAVGELVGDQAQHINLRDLIEAPENILQQIYAVTGGNPLAVKMVVGLAAVLPLPDILDDLTSVQTNEVEQLYGRIYRQAWRSLGEDAQTLLEMMPMAAGIGIKPVQMQRMSSLSKAKLWQAITELVNRSLLEVRGTAWERRYGIHRLTDSFLRTEIIRWPDFS